MDTGLLGPIKEGTKFELEIRSIRDSSEARGLDILGIAWLDDDDTVQFQRAIDRRIRSRIGHIGD